MAGKLTRLEAQALVYRSWQFTRDRTARTSPVAARSFSVSLTKPILSTNGHRPSVGTPSKRAGAPMRMMSDAAKKARAEDRRSGTCRR